MNKLVIIACMCLGLLNSINAQTSLPTSWNCDNGTPPSGWNFIQTGGVINNYSGSFSCDSISCLRLDFDNEALVIYFSEQPGTFSYQIGGTAGGGLTAWAGVFSVDESVDGNNWVNVKTYQNSGELPVGDCLNETYNFANTASRYLRFFYTDKISGANVRLDEISIVEPIVTETTPLQYQLNQQGNGNCPGSNVTLSVSTSVNITTTVVSEITGSAATTGGNIINDGGNPVSLRGVCWSTSPNPTINDNITNNVNGLGSFTSNLSGLSPNTLYFVRAYAINSSGTFYGNEISFATPNEANPSDHSCGAENVHNPNLNYGSMTDQEGNVYKTIVIGNQEWMAENLSTSVYRNGDSIPAIAGAGWPTSQAPFGAYYNNNGNNPPDCPYGKLYNWYAVADPRELCPADWHVPSDEEWNELIGYLDSNYIPDLLLSYYQSLIAGSSLKSTSTNFWTNPSNIASNSSGFSALPAGWVNNGELINFGEFGYYWSSTSVCGPCTFAWHRLILQDGKITKVLSNRQMVQGFSVRCLRDNDNNEGFSINCDAPTNIGVLLAGVPVSDVTSTISYTGSIGHTFNSQSTGSYGVLGLGAKWEGTIADGNGNITISIFGTPTSIGTANFDLLIRGQTCTLSLDVFTAPQAHSCGAFNVHNPAKTYGSMTDQEGNVYKTIVIGNQEWMAENLKTSIYRNGEPISTNLTDEEWQNTINTQIGAWVFYNNDSQFDCPFGKLYNWYAVADPRNVCPTGWHVPSDAEWTVLTNYAGGVEVAGGKMKSTGTQYWYDPNNDSTNETGFSGLPGALWSSSDLETSFAYNRELSYNDIYVIRSFNYKQTGSSVRCLRD